MDWKRFYADEIAQPAGRAAALAALERHARGDAAIQAALQSGGIASFPHVSIHDSAEPIARVVQSILESGRQHVVALGVLHGGTLPAAYRQAWSALGSGSPAAAQAWERYAGATLARGAATTPFGPVGEGVRPAGARCIHDDQALLGGEFSLDLFLALLAAAAMARGRRPPAVTRLFVSATRSPDGRFDMAQALAAEIAGLVDADTVCVATGDLAHVGHGYMPEDAVAALPAGNAALEAAVRAGIVGQHAAALQDGDLAAAWALGSRWGNDQRQMLPVIASLVGRGARYELLSLELSDYAAINGVPAPCFVAAALGLFVPALAAPQAGMPRN